jgi:hypothetical protein
MRVYYAEVSRCSPRGCLDPPLYPYIDALVRARRLVTDRVRGATGETDHVCDGVCRFLFAPQGTSNAEKALQISCAE